MKIFQSLLKSKEKLNIIQPGLYWYLYQYSHNIQFLIFFMEEGAQERLKCLRHTKVIMQPYLPMFMLMLSGGNFLPLPSSILPFRPQFMNHLSWGNFPWENFLLHLTSIPSPHILTPSLVYVLLMCIALSLRLHVVLQWPISMESLRD